MTPRKPTEPELELWHHATRDVVSRATKPKRLRPPKDHPAQAAKPSPKSAAKSAPPSPELSSRATPSKRTPVIQPNEHRLDRRTASKLKSGAIRPARTLDLHGLTQVEAHRALDRLIARAVETGERCILVVTGKSGVLRRAAPEWLKAGPHAARILGVEPKTDASGGAGALYVYLRRARNAP